MIEGPVNNELERRIDLYLEGKLSHEEIDELWADLLQDKYYYDYMKTAATLKGMAQEKQSEAKIYTFSPLKQAYLAAAMILVAAAFVVFNLYDESGVTTVEPVSAIELDYYRSADGLATEGQYSEKLMIVISAANRGDIEGAIAIIDRELAASSDPVLSHELLVTAGSILYNAGRYDLALERFEAGVQLNSPDILLNERNYWYLGNTYFQLNMIDEAKVALERAYDLNGAYSRIAQSYLRALSE
jgi:tetratricopeptide (TPR) repeat protein